MPTPKPPSPLFPRCSADPPRLGRIHSRVPRVLIVAGRDAGSGAAWLTADDGGFPRRPRVSQTRLSMLLRRGSPSLSGPHRAEVGGSSLLTMATLEILRFFFLQPGINNVFKLVTPSSLSLSTPGGEMNFGSWLDFSSIKTKVRPQSPSSLRGNRPIRFGS